MGTWMQFEKGAGCGWDIGTGEGERSCSWGECAYLPEELDVYCEQCRFNYFSLEGNPTCDDPLTCEHASVPLAHVENYRRWATARGIPFGARYSCIGSREGHRALVDPCGVNKFDRPIDMRRCRDAWESVRLRPCSRASCIGCCAGFSACSSGWASMTGTWRSPCSAIS